MHSTHKTVYLAYANIHTNNLLAHSDCHHCKRGVTRIQGKWEWERERNTGTETCKIVVIQCTLDLSPLRFTELYKPSHWYTIVVKFFLLHNALSNKHPCKTVYRMMSFVIYYNLQVFI